jgi:hypothetical protein
VPRRVVLGETGAVGWRGKAFWLGEHSPAGGRGGFGAGEPEEDAAWGGGGGGRSRGYPAPDQAGLGEQEAGDGGCCRCHGCLTLSAFA